jgi:hypothetical protein
VRRLVQAGPVEKQRRRRVAYGNHLCGCDKRESMSGGGPDEFCDRRGLNGHSQACLPGRDPTGVRPTGQMRLPSGRLKFRPRLCPKDPDEHCLRSRARQSMLRDGWWLELAGDRLARARRRWSRWLFGSTDMPFGSALRVRWASLKATSEQQSKLGSIRID